jgi:hypothetical protein
MVGNRRKSRMSLWRGFKGRLANLERDNTVAQNREKNTEKKMKKGSRGYN